MFLSHVPYVVLIDDADGDGLQAALKYLPPSRMFCTILITSQMVQQENLRAYLAATQGSAILTNHVDVCELQPFTSDESMRLLIDHLCRRAGNPSWLIPYISIADVQSRLRATFEALGHLPLGVRLFGLWLNREYILRTSRAETETAGRLDVMDLLNVWPNTSVRLQPSECHVRGLQRTVSLMLQQLDADAALSPGMKNASKQLLGLLALCPQLVPWSLFDGGSMYEALLVRGARAKVRRGDSSELDWSPCRIQQLPDGDGNVSVVFGCDTGECCTRKFFTQSHFVTSAQDH
jgi:hypothetical protein